MTRINYIKDIMKADGADSMRKKQSLIKGINRLKEEHNAVLLAHVYQEFEIQDIADFIGDSLELSKKAADTNADIIVLCGVTFMAETAYILNSKKTVLIPEKNAGCNLADMVTLSKLKKMKKKHPHAAIVSYVNSSAQIKAESDICCTSANAVKIVESLNTNQILFLPDKNLGSYVAEQTDKNIILWDGFCYVHEQIKLETIQKLKIQHPEAEVIAHPECNPKIRTLSDFIGSTSKMALYVSESNSQAFIVATDDNFIHHLKARNPSKTFYPVGAACVTMRKITLERLYDSLKYHQYIITLRDDIRFKAKKALDAMMKIS